MDRTRTLEWRLSWFSRVVVATCIFSPTLAASTADVRNAAPLYYQAIIQCPDLHQFPSEVVDEVCRGAGSIENTKLYVDKHRAVIEKVEAAARVDRCEWGIPLHRAPSFRVPAAARVRTILFLFAANARMLTEDGDCAAALQKLVTLRQFAAHAASEPNLGVMMPLLIEGNAHNFLRHTMSVMPPQTELLTWLRDQLTPDPFDRDWLVAVFHADFERTLLELRTDNTVLGRFRTIIPTHSSAARKAKIEAWSNIDDEELVSRIREPYARFLGDIAEVLKDDALYRQAYETMDSLTQSLEQRALDDPAIISNWLIYAEAIPGHYSALFLHKASLNALRVGVEVYLARARTGQLPTAVPAGLPKDPLTGKDFEYELIEGGFLLRCGVELGGFSMVPQFEFKTKE